MTQRHDIDEGSDEPAEDAIQNALRGLRFGSVEIVVHDGKIVQIVRTERVRVASPDKSQDAPKTPTAKTSRRV